MTIRDHNGLALSGADAAAAEAYRQALFAYQCYAGDPIGVLAPALAAQPGFVMGHVLTAHLTLIGANAEVRKLGLAACAAAKDLPMTDRERGHVTAIGCMARGELAKAGRVLEDVSAAWPLDALALQGGQIIDYLRGDSRMLRDRIGRALPMWSASATEYHAVLGMLAFGLEECGQYARAEAAGRRACELEPRNGWARHAVAHVLEMEDRREDGIAWMRGSIPDWTEESFFQVHNWWHLALFHLGLGELDEVLALYDGPIRGGRSDMALDLVDASALLWRLHLRGRPLEARFAALADIYAGLNPGESAFDDWHAVMALVGAGRLKDARAVVAVQAGPLSGDNLGFVRDVGLAVMQGVLAFGEGRCGDCVEALRGVRNQAARFGGSHAQRDLIDLTLIEAAARAGDRALERALRAERAVALGGEAGARLLAA